MQRIGPRRPSPAMVVALIALFVALGGSGYAAVKINGKNLTNRSVTGKKVKRNTLGGSEIRESRLAKVPAATRADSAGSAGSARSATSANSADSAAFASRAANASTLGGLGASSYLSADDVLFATVTTAPTGATVVPERSRGAIGATRIGVGFYNVAFDRDISNCTWNVTGGSTEDATLAYNAVARVPQDPPGGPNQLGVVVSNVGVAADGSALFIVIHCP